MLIDETLIELFDIDMGFKRIFRLKWFVVKKNDFFSTATQILESVLCQGTLFKVCQRYTHQGHPIAFSDFYIFIYVRKK